MEWDENLWTLHSDLTEAITMFENIMFEIKEAVKPDAIIVALSDATKRFRQDVMPTYKNNRKKTRRPVVFGPLRAYVHEKYETFEREGLEGDDVLGILATRKAAKGDKHVIVSIDKDMKTIPGYLFNYGKPENGIVFITEDEANYYHLYQTLTGDSTDGYPGCPGIGPVSADKILNEFWFEVKKGERHFDEDAAWLAVEKAYRKAGLGEDVALMNARVARILRSEDYDFKNKRPILWTP